MFKEIMDLFYLVLMWEFLEMDWVKLILFYYRLILGIFIWFMNFYRLDR